MVCARTSIAILIPVDYTQTIMVFTQFLDVKAPKTLEQATPLRNVSSVF